MNSQREGSNLKTQIQMALSGLGKPLMTSFKGMTLAELRELNSELHSELRRETIRKENLKTTESS